MSYVLNYQPSELRYLHVAYDGEKKSVSEFGLYEERNYPGPPPYVFAPADRVDEICRLINEAYTRLFRGTLDTTCD